ncbi:MAG TPA: tetratricopeptide repeat protein [Terriglobales bacterium]|nr:tetratricopeptide repeat protein [Terriglobales bacterium]
MATAQPAPAEGQRDLTGTNVGRFAIRALLGAGGMGEVYRAEDTKLKRSVALKRVSQRLGSDQRSRQRILREAERASGLNSPHIASVHDVLEHDGEVFLVMEYVEGTTLRQRLRTGSLPLPEFFDVAVQCGEALDVAHRKGIVHRDIKPENIMLTADRQVKVLDFGLARRLPWADEGAITSSFESDTSFGGTPGYMAPEALLEQELDSRSDIFSLGVVFYETATGRHPFRADKSVARGPRVPSAPEPVSHVVREAPADLDRVISKMLARDPEQRYATAADLLVDLRALERGGSLPAPAVEQPGRKWIRSTLRVLVVAVILAVLLTAFPAVRKQWKQWFGGPELPEKKHIAVLPFVPASDDPDARAFAQGLTETLTAKLTQLTDKYPLQVVPVSEIREQKINSVQQARVGLGVNLVVEGSMRQAGGLVRVTYNLVDAQSRRELRADTITATPSDPFAVEDRVVAGVLNTLELELGENAKASERGTNQPAVYELYLRGRGYLHEYHTPENIDSAIANFKGALEREPNYALAHAGLGEAYWYKYEQTHKAEWVEKAQAACRRAAGLGGGHACLGRVYTGTGKYEEAVAEFRRALQSDPTDDAAYRGLAFAYEQVGRVADAEQTYRRAISVRPQYWAGYSWLGRFLFQRARYEEAAEMFKQVTALAPDSYRGYYNLGGIRIAQGRYEEAIAVLQKSVAIRPSPSGYSNLGTAYFYLRRFGDAARSYHAALNLDDHDYVLWGNLAEAYYWTPGERDKSLATCRRAIVLAQQRLKVNPRDANVLGWLASYHAILGDRTAAQKFLDDALAISPGDADMRLRAAVIYIKLGDRERSFRWLEKALAAGIPQSQIRNYPSFDILASDARFRKLIQETASGPRT